MTTISTVVLDTSVAGRWTLADTLEPELHELRCTSLVWGVHVPALFTFEVAHMLTRWARKFSKGEADVAAVMLGNVPTRVDADAPAPSALMELALATGLSGYDAAYLELAERLELPLATVDAKLAAAARARGVMVVP